MTRKKEINLQHFTFKSHNFLKDSFKVKFYCFQLGVGYVLMNAGFLGVQEIPVVRVTNSSEPYDMPAGNQSQVFYKSSICS